MIYESSKEMIILIFLVVIVNLLVIPSVYKKIMIFYLQFMVIIIILKPVIRIMGNEVTSQLGFQPFISEESFEDSVQYYQNHLKSDIQTMTYEGVSEQIKHSSDVCGVSVNRFELSDQLLVWTMQPLSDTKVYCLASEMGLTQSDIIFMEEEVNE